MKSPITSHTKEGWREKPNGFLSHPSRDERYALTNSPQTCKSVQGPNVVCRPRAPKPGARGFQKFWTKALKGDH